MSSNVDRRPFQEVAAETGLGEVVGRYRPAVGADVAIVVVVAFLGIMLIAAGGDAGAVVGAGVVVLALGALAAWVTWRKAGRWRYLYPGGSLTTDRTGAVTSLFTWHDVAHLRIWVRVVNLVSAYAEVPQCRVELRSGEVVDLAKPRYQDTPALIAYVEKSVAAAILPVKVDEAVRTGAATFGPLTLTGDGVRRGEQFVAWSAVTNVEAGKTHLKLWTDARRPALAERLRNIPDVAVLLHLMQHWPVAEEPDVPA
ncbi:DUF6585 family protein [Catellatospora sp. NPDC049609]|uniref:DUF6585 family protein n=1 Tax=Catellatospora sp. NPDC049609 TaxID=3155505 RepID=UPI0034488869